MKKNLLQSELRFRTLFNVAQDAIFMMEDNRFIECNQATLNIFGCKEEQIVGETPVRFSPPKQPDGRPSADSALEKINAAINDQPQFFEWKHIRYDGTPFDAEVSLNKLEIDDHVYLLAIVRDVTDRKQAEKAIKKKNKELLQINEELDRLVYSASHDLRAPISSLLGLVNLLREEKDPDKIAELVDHQERSLLRLDKFIQDIVDYSRNKRLDFEMRPIDIKKEFYDTLDQLNFLEKVDEIVKEIEIKGVKSFYSDVRRFRIILNNLISNAVKYIDPDKESNNIKLKADIQDERVLIELEDNGVGIEKAHRERIFDMFYRATNRGSGSGLGLYIVKDAIDKLGGTIVVESEVGKGTTFTLELPNLKG